MDGLNLKRKKYLQIQPMSSKDFKVKTKEEVRDDYIRTLSSGLQKIGFTNVQMGEGSYDYVRGEALGLFYEDLAANIQRSANDLMPDSALGTALSRHAGIRNLFLRAAGPSEGFIVLESSVSVAVLIPSGQQLLDSKGLRYQVAIGGAFFNGDLILIRAVDTGETTNLEAGTILRWVSPSAFVKSTCAIAIGGFTGGVNAEGDEELRFRLLDKLKNYPKNSNWAALNASAEQATTFVQKAFSYPGIYGPATVHLALAGRPTATNKERAVSVSVINDFVRPVVENEHPEYADLVITGCTPVPVSAYFYLTIPTSPKASPPGPGGGWVDGTPWPVQTSPNLPVTITSVAASDDFTVLADFVPVVGTSIAYVAGGNFKFYRAKIKQIVSSTPSGSQYFVRVKIDSPFYSDDSASLPPQLDEIIFPDAENMENYVQRVFDVFEQMGPFEKTDVAGLLTRASRKPLISQSWKAQVGGQFLRGLRDIEEVDDADFITTPTAITINYNYQEPPNLAVPEYVGFYPFPS